MGWGEAVVFAGYSGFLPYLQLASHELATIGINVTKNEIPKFHNMAEKLTINEIPKSKPHSSKIHLAVHVQISLREEGITKGDFFKAQEMCYKTQILLCG